MTAIDFLLPICTAAVTFGLTALAQPLLRGYALARPNLRSSHTVPTPQGGGIVVVAVTLAVVIAAAHLQAVAGVGGSNLAWLMSATLMLAALGAIDDLVMLGAVSRLVSQVVIVGMVVASLPVELRVFPALPLWIERLLTLIAGIWFINLVNFMDGIDWMTIAEVVPTTAALAAFGLMGALPREGTVLALALCGAMIGFAPFNRPVARLFLGDVGSLPIGLLLGWLLVLLAGSGHLIAALLLPLYYLADATVTLLRRFAKGEPLMTAHRSHFYQRALDSGFRVYDIVGRIFLVNVLLFGLAFSTLATASLALHVAAAFAGCILVGLLLAQFSRVKP